MANRTKKKTNKRLIGKQLAGDEMMKEQLNKKKKRNWQLKEVGAEKISHFWILWGHRRPAVKKKKE